MLTQRRRATSVRTSLAAKAVLRVVVWSLDVSPPAVMISPHALHTRAMRPSNPPGNMALSVATTSQLLAAPASCQRRLRDKTVCGAHLGYLPIRLVSHE